MILIQQRRAAFLVAFRHGLSLLNFWVCAVSVVEFRTVVLKIIYFKFSISVVLASLLYTWLVLVFNILNFVQTKGTVSMKSLTIISGQLHLLHQFESDFAHLLAFKNLDI